MSTPSRPAEVAVFYRTFEAIWSEEGPYDWEAELRETIEHELEHHDAALLGHDPMDEEERREIEDEAGRIIGKKAAIRGGVKGLAHDVAGFFRKTWLLWAILVVAVVILSLLEGK